MAAYHCTKCNRTHVRGKIYDEHKQFARGEMATQTWVDESADWSDIDKPMMPPPKPATVIPAQTMNFRLAVWEWDDPNTGERKTRPFSPSEEVVHAKDIAAARGQKWGFWAKRRQAKLRKRLGI